TVEVVAVGEVGDPGRAVGRRDDRVQPVRREGAVDRGARGVRRRGPLRAVGRVGQVAAGRLGQLEDLLAEERQLLRGVVAVELDQPGQVAGVRAGSGGQVRVDVVLELQQQRVELVRVHHAEVGQRQFEYGRAAGAQCP